MRRTSLVNLPKCRIFCYARDNNNGSAFISNHLDTGKRFVFRCAEYARNRSGRTTFAFVPKSKRFWCGLFRYIHISISSDALLCRRTSCSTWCRSGLISRRSSHRNGSVLSILLVIGSSSTVTPACDSLSAIDVIRIKHVLCCCWIRCLYDFNWNGWVEHHKEEQ